MAFTSFKKEMLYCSNKGGHAWTVGPCIQTPPTVVLTTWKSSSLWIVFCVVKKHPSGDVPAMRTQYFSAPRLISGEEQYWRNWGGCTSCLDVGNIYKTAWKWQEKGCGKTTFRYWRIRSHRLKGHEMETAKRRPVAPRVGEEKKKTTQQPRRRLPNMQFGPWKKKMKQDGV